MLVRSEKHPAQRLTNHAYGHLALQAEGGNPETVVGYIIALSRCWVKIKEGHRVSLNVDWPYVGHVCLPMLVRMLQLTVPWLKRFLQTSRS